MSTYIDIMRRLQSEKNKATEKILDNQHDETLPEEVQIDCTDLKMGKNKEQ